LKFTTRIHILMGITLILCLGLTSLTTVSAESAPSIITFEIQGNTHIPAEKILGVITNTKMGALFDAQKVRLDVQAIMAMGYFADVQVKTDKMLDGVKIIFEVFENPLYKEVQISGLTRVKPETLQSFFTQKPGEVFNTETFKTNLSKAIKSCQETQGVWVQPRNSDKLGIDADGVVKIDLVELKYGKIKIQGLVKTKEKVVTRELSIKTGDIIDRNVLQDEISRLMRLRIFDGVDPQLEMSEIPDSLDLTLQFKEAQTGSFSFGVSYSETSQTWGGLLGYGESNLMGLAQNLSLDLNYSVQDTASRQVQFSFNEPWLSDNHTSFGLSVWNSDSVITSTMNCFGINDPNPYDIDLVRTGMSVSLGRQLAKDTTGQVKLNFEKNRLKDAWTTDTTSSDETSDNSILSNLGPSLTEFWDNSAELIATKNKLVYQDSNFVNGGYRLSADYTVAGKYLGGAFNYNKSVLDGRWFKSLLPDLVLGTRLQAANISGDYPDYDSLYLGGMYRLRGYPDRRFSDSISQDIIGDTYLLSNTELRWRIPGNRNFELVGFYDIGAMKNLGDNTHAKSDYGVGLRFNVPMLGLIRLDQAWNADGESRVVFSLGELF